MTRSTKRLCELMDRKRAIALAAYMVFAIVISAYAIYMHIRGYQQHTNVFDYSAYFSAARALTEEGAEQVYQPNGGHSRAYNHYFGWQISSGGADDYYPYIYPPVSLPLLYLVAANDYVASYIIWSVINIVLAAWLVYRLRDLLTLLGRPRWWPVAAVATIGNGAFIQILLQGQVSLILAVGFLECLLALHAQRFPRAGIALCVFCLKPHLVLPLWLYLACVKPYRPVAFWSAAMGAALFTISLLLYGIVPWQAFLAMIGHVNQSGTGFRAAYVHMVSLRGILSDYMPFLSEQAVMRIAWCAYLASLALAAGWGCGRISQRYNHYASEMRFLRLLAVFCIGLISSPWFHIQDCFLLVTPALVLMRIIHERNLTEFRYALKIGAALIALSFTPIIPGVCRYVLIMVIVGLLRAIVHLRAGAELSR